MGRPKTENDVAVSLRLDASTRQRMEALQGSIAPTQLSLSQVMRAALQLGLKELEKGQR